MMTTIVRVTMVMMIIAMSIVIKLLTSFQRIIFHTFALPRIFVKKAIRKQYLFEKLTSI